MMKTIPAGLFALLVFTLLPGISKAQTPIEKAAATIASEELPPVAGVALGRVMKDQQVFASAGKMRQNGPDIDENTLFEIGSITKVFTGILLADAILKEKATLDTTLAEVFGEDLQEESAAGRITLKELTTHTAGLISFPREIYEEDDYNPLDPYANFDEADLLLYLNRFEEDQFENPGEYSYSNLGVGILGIALERLSGQPFETLLSEVILEPLEMDDTYLQRRPGFIPDAALERFATGHAYEAPAPHWHIDALCAAGAIVSSASDMAKFATAHWSDETPQSLRAAMDLAATKQTDKMGLGWHFRGERLFHNGGTGGVRTSLFITPGEQSARIDLRNSTGLAPEAPEGDLTRFSGFWTGTLDTGAKQLPLIFRIQKNGTVFLYSLAQTGAPIAATRVKEDEARLQLGFASLNGTFSGEQNGDLLSGTWKQVEEYPLELTRSPKVPTELRDYLKDKVEGDTKELSGYWSGFLGGKDGVFVILHLEWLWGTLDPKIYRPAQSPAPINVSSLKFDGETLSLSCDEINASFEGKLDGNSTLTGTWNQVGQQSLDLTKSETRPERP